MRYIKKLGLAAVAAMALTALVGAGTASATELCSTNTEMCTSGTMYPGGTAITAQLKTGTVATLTSSLGNVTCKKSTASGQTTNTGATTEPVFGDIEALTFTECKLKTLFGEDNCTVTSTGLPTEVEGLATGGGNGTMSTGSAGAHVECPIIDCNFSAPEIQLGVTGGNPAILVANKETLASEGGFCPEIAQWDAEYEITSPKPLFLVSP